MAGLSLLTRALSEGLWKDKRLLLVDRSFPTDNHKTWCFWQKEKGPFEHLVHRSWEHMLFFTHNGKQLDLNTNGYRYKMIRSGDFYAHCHRLVRSHTNVEWQQMDVQREEDLFALGHEHTLYFSSLYQKPELRSKDHYFLQHFKGWIIRSEALRIDPSTIHLMDFRTSQQYGTAFVYTLPLSHTEVFVEYTLFTTSLLAPEQYDAALRTYIGDVLRLDSYQVIEEEFGVIPMTNHRFRRTHGSVMRIGTAGGDTRASTGYTFTHTQRTIDRILSNVRSGSHPLHIADHPVKNYYFDSAILEVLSRGNYPGSLVFEHMFGRLPAWLILKFLDSQTHFAEDIRLMNSVRKAPFIRAVAKYLVG